MARLFQKRPPAAPQPVNGAIEAEVVRWSQAADEAAQALALALAMRRTSMSKLSGRTALRSKSPVNNQLSNYAIARSLAFHRDKASGKSIIDHLGGMHISLPSRVSFEHAARTCIASSAAGRPPPDPVGATDTLIPAGGRTVAVP